jgi:hypothetical protein
MPNSVLKKVVDPLVDIGLLRDFSFSSIVLPSQLDSFERFAYHTFDIDEVVYPFSTLLLNIY